RSCGAWLTPGVDVCLSCPGAGAGRGAAPKSAPRDALATGEAALELELVDGGRRGAQDRSLAPAARAPKQPSQHAERVEAAMLADYGSSPGGWLGTIPYAMAVVRRRQELRRLRHSAEERRDLARREAQAALAALGDVLLDLAEEASLSGLDRQL